MSKTKPNTDTISEHVSAPEPVRRKLEPTLLYSRADALPYIGQPSLMTVVRLEKAGRLTPIRLDPRVKGGKVYYRGHELIAMIEGEMSNDRA